MLSPTPSSALVLFGSRRTSFNGNPRIHSRCSLLHRIMAVKLLVLFVCGAVFMPSESNQPPSTQLLPLLHFLSSPRKLNPAPVFKTALSHFKRIGCLNNSIFTSIILLYRVCVKYCKKFAVIMMSYHLIKSSSSISKHLLS